MQGGGGAAQETTLHESKDLSALYTSLCCVGFVEGSVIIIPLIEQRGSVVPIER